jgi:hypothetical protein
MSMLMASVGLDITLKAHITMDEVEIVENFMVNG